jgi:ribonuclease Z
MQDQFAGFSRGVYANWFWHRPLQLLIDAGEGLALALGTHVFAPSVVAITHGHSDHVFGLPGFAGARRFGKGATTRPWTVVFPVGTRSIDTIRTAITDLWRDVAFPITWTAVSPGARVPLRGSQVLEAFAVTHVPGEPALGYRVVETRRRLKATYAHLRGPEIERLAREHGRDHVMEPFDHVIFAHSGDAHHGCRPARARCHLSGVGRSPRPHPRDLRRSPRARPHSAREDTGPDTCVDSLRAARGSGAPARTGRWQRLLGTVLVARRRHLRPAHRLTPHAPQDLGFVTRAVFVFNL